jgi:hypothetical protein
MSVEQRGQDLRVLRALESELGDELPDALESMLLRLDERRQDTLTPAQRKWVNDVAARNQVAPSVGPEEDDGPEPTRLTAGEVPRGKEVAPMFAKGPLRPPGRR